MLTRGSRMRRAVTLALGCVALAAAGPLDDYLPSMAIADDIFPPSSDKCDYDFEADDSTSTTSFSDVFTSKQSISGWNEINAAFEDDVFNQEMTHTDKNTNRTWSARFGSSGHIYSYITPGLGEVLPPQKHDKGPFQDEVWQMVMVDITLNDPYVEANGENYVDDDNKYFIHQAGIYQSDPGPGDILDTKPFYSPSLAKHCSGRQCTFAAWGQHAHVPTGQSLSLDASLSLFALRLTRPRTYRLEKLMHLLHEVQRLWQRRA